MKSIIKRLMIQLGMSENSEVSKGLSQIVTDVSQASKERAADAYDKGFKDGYETAIEHNAITFNDENVKLLKFAVYILSQWRVEKYWDDGLCERCYDAEKLVRGFISTQDDFGEN